MSDSPTQQLAEHYSSMSLEDVPTSVIDIAADIVLDTIASAIAGRRGDETAQIEKLAYALSPDQTVSVLAGGKCSLAGAALINGYQVTAVTVCDIHRPTLCHVSPEVIPPALAVAEDRRASGQDFLLAVIKGLEAVVRVGAGMRYPEMRAKGWHSPGVIGPFGGAAAVGSLMGLDAVRQGNAFALAGTQSAGTFAHWGTPTIKFHQSRGSYSGLLAALLAETGFKAGPNVLMADHGGLYRLYTDGGDPGAVTAGLGDDWQLETISLRLWPAASSIQSVISALFGLIEKHDVRPEGIQRVRVGLSPTVYKMHGQLPWDTKFSALLSAPYVTGVVLHDRKCWFDQFVPERFSDAALDSFVRKKVVVEADDSVEGTGAVVEITTATGDVLEDRRLYPKGDAADRLSRDEIILKFRQSAEGLIAERETDAAIERLCDIRNVPDMSEVMSLLREPLREAA